MYQVKRCDQKPPPSAALPTSTLSWRQGTYPSPTTLPTPQEWRDPQSATPGRKSPTKNSLCRETCPRLENASVVRGTSRAPVLATGSVKPARAPRYSEAKTPISTGFTAYPANACRASTSALNFEHFSGGLAALNHGQGGAAASGR